MAEATRLAGSDSRRDWTSGFFCFCYWSARVAVALMGRVTTTRLSQLGAMAKSTRVLSLLCWRAARHEQESGYRGLERGRLPVHGTALSRPQTSNISPCTSFHPT